MTHTPSFHTLSTAVGEFILILSCISVVLCAALYAIRYGSDLSIQGLDRLNKVLGIHRDWIYFLYHRRTLKYIIRKQHARRTPPRPTHRDTRNAKYTLQPPKGEPVNDLQPVGAPNDETVLDILAYFDNSEPNTLYIVSGDEENFYGTDVAKLARAYRALDENHKDLLRVAERSYSVLQRQAESTSRVLGTVSPELLATRDVLWNYLRASGIALGIVLALFLPCSRSSAQTAPGSRFSIVGKEVLYEGTTAIYVARTIRDNRTGREFVCLRWTQSVLGSTDSLSCVTLKAGHK